MQEVQLIDVSKSYGSVDVIAGLSLEIEAGSFTALLGPSGCGKSTLLRMIAGLEEISKGQCLIGRRDVTHVPPAKRGVAMVFQNYALYPHLTVRDNIGFSLSIAGAKKAVQDRRVMDVARMLQLEDLLERRPAQLSGGQRQRVAIGRALVREPEVFLFDEPLSNLDALLRVQMRFELAKLHQDVKATMIYVTHDQIEAMTLADKIVVLDRGRISQQGSPLELYNHPNNKFVAAFIGSPAMNFFKSTIVGRDGGKVCLDLPDGRPMEIATRDGEASSENVVEVGIRPEHLEIGSPGSPNASFDAIVSIVEQLGNATMAHVDSPVGRLVIESDGNLRVRPGDSVGVRLDLACAHLFGSDGRVI